MHAEYHRATPTVSPPAGGAWIDSSTFNSAADNGGAMPNSGRSTHPNGSCASWTDANPGRNATTMTTANSVLGACDVQRPLACCGA